MKVALFVGRGESIFSFRYISGSAVKVNVGVLSNRRRIIILCQMKVNTSSLPHTPSLLLTCSKEIKNKENVS